MTGMGCGHGCCDTYREHLLSIAVAPSATPSRNGGRHALITNETEKEWARDHAAYRRMVKDGLQPAVLDGAAHMERHATSAAEIEHGLGAPANYKELLGEVGSMIGKAS